MLTFSEESGKINLLFAHPPLPPPPPLHDSFTSSFSFRLLFTPFVFSFPARYTHYYAAGVASVFAYSANWKTTTRATTTGKRVTHPRKNKPTTKHAQGTLFFFCPRLRVFHPAPSLFVSPFFLNRSFVLNAANLKEKRKKRKRKISNPSQFDWEACALCKLTYRRRLLFQPAAALLYLRVCVCVYALECVLVCIFRAATAPSEARGRGLNKF